jgi:hypothetical protein
MFPASGWSTFGMRAASERKIITVIISRTYNNQAKQAGKIKGISDMHVRSTMQLPINI